MNSKVIVVVTVVLAILAAGLLVGITNPPFLHKEPGLNIPGEETQETAAPQEEEHKTESVLVTLDNYDWSKGLPSWDVLNNTAMNLTRLELDFLKGAVSAGLFYSGPTDSINESQLQENLAMKNRIGANVYEARLSFVYRNGRFQPPGPEGESADVFLRSVMTDGLLAKKAGLAVNLALGFFPENGFQSVEELRKALDAWENVVVDVAVLAEKYKFEYFNPCGELDHVLRVDSGLRLPEETIVEILNEYYPKYFSAARKVFNGKLVTQLGDVFEALKDSILSYDLSDVDMVGMLVGDKISWFDEERFRNDMMKNIEIMRTLCEKNNNTWYVSEVWFYDDKPVTQEKLQKQADCFKTLFSIIKSVNSSVTKGPYGVMIMNWNLREEEIFADIINKPAEKVVAEFFSSGHVEHGTSEGELQEGTVPLYPGAVSTWFPEQDWSDMGIPSEASRKAYTVAASMEKILEWYDNQMTGWSLMKNETSSDPERGTSMGYHLYKSGENAVIIFVMKDQDMPENQVVLGIASGSWLTLQGFDPFSVQGETSGEEVFSEFYDYPELGEGPVTFKICPLDFDDFSSIEPLGNINPEGGHTFPSDHGGFMFANPDAYPPSYVVRAPADGIIVEIHWRRNQWPQESGFSGEYDDYKIVIAHTSTFISYLDHVSKLDEAILEKAGTLEVGMNRVEIPVKAGDVLGLAGGRPKTQMGMDWGVYDRNITHFVHPEKYFRMAHAAHFLTYCSEDLRAKLAERVQRTVPPVEGEFDFDQPGKLVGNWFLEGIDESDPLSEWDKHLSFVYYMYEPNSIRIGVGGTLNIKAAVYAVQGNTPDPADVTVDAGKVVYWLYGAPEMGADYAQKATLIVQMVTDEKIKVEAFDGWIENPDFTENAVYYTR